MAGGVGARHGRRALLRLRPSTLPAAIFPTVETRTVGPRIAASAGRSGRRYLQHSATTFAWRCPVGNGIAGGSLPSGQHTTVSPIGPRCSSYHTSSVAAMSPSRFVRRRGKVSEKMAKAVTDRAREEARRDEEARAAGRKAKEPSSSIASAAAAALEPPSIAGLDPGDAGDVTGMGIVPLGTSDGDDDDDERELERGSRRHHRRREQIAAEAAAATATATSQHGRAKEVSFAKVLSILVPELGTLAIGLGAIGVGTFATMQFPHAIGTMIDILSVSAATATVGGPDAAASAGADVAAAAAATSGALDAAAADAPAPTMTDDKMSQMRSIALAMMGYFTLGSIATAVHTALFDSVGQKIGAALRLKLFGTVLHSDAAFFDVERAGELANRLSADVHEVAEHLVQNVAVFLHNFVRSGAAVGAMFLISPGLTACSSAVIPAVALCAAFYGKRIKRLSRRHLDALADGTHFATERFAGIVTVMAFGQRATEVGRYGSIIDGAYQLARRVALYQGAFMGTSYFVGNAALLGVLWLGAGLVFEGSMTAGQLASFCMYAGYLAEGIGEITESAAGFLRAQGSGARLFGLLEKDMEDNKGIDKDKDKMGEEKSWRDADAHDDGTGTGKSADDSGMRGWQVVVKEVKALGELRTTIQRTARPPHERQQVSGGAARPQPALAVAPTAAYANRSAPSSSFSDDSDRGGGGGGGNASVLSPNLTPLMLPDGYVGNVEFENVSFAYPTYPDSPVLRDVSVTLKVGEMMAVTGPSGCGKSSLISLLLRLYEPSGGRITVDGVDVRDLDVDWLRKQMGNVPQDPLLFNGTVLDNVRYGKPEADEAEVIRACEAVGVHRFIDSLPDSYGTMVGERGTSLSGGQRQRLSVARALLTKPRILALDEATSALDFASERLVFGSLRRLVNDPDSSVTSALVLTHHLSVFSACNHVAVMEEGRVVEKGPWGSLRYTQAGGKNQPVGGGGDAVTSSSQVCQIRRGRRSTHLPWSSFSSSEV